MRNYTQQHLECDHCHSKEVQNYIGKRILCSEHYQKFVAVLQKVFKVSLDRAIEMAHGSIYKGE